MSSPALRRHFKNLVDWVASITISPFVRKAGTVVSDPIKIPSPAFILIPERPRKSPCCNLIFFPPLKISILWVIKKAGLTADWMSMMPSLESTPIPVKPNSWASLKITSLWLFRKISEGVFKIESITRSPVSVSILIPVLASRTALISKGLLSPAARMSMAPRLAITRGVVVPSWVNVLMLSRNSPESASRFAGKEKLLAFLTLKYPWVSRLPPRFKCPSMSKR